MINYKEQMTRNVEEEKENVDITANASEGQAIKISLRVKIGRWKRKRPFY